MRPTSPKIRLIRQLTDSIVSDGLISLGVEWSFVLVLVTVAVWRDPGIPATRYWQRFLDEVS